jgi:ketosteroid isomerase-like protein
MTGKERRMREIDEIDRTLRRLGRMLFDRDEAFAEEFAEDGVLVGSEPGEIAAGRGAIRALVGKLYARPARYIWDWRTIDIKVDGDVGWLFAEGLLVQSDGDGRTELPYRVSGVFGWSGERWLWRQFHGSEPAIR